MHFCFQLDRFTETQPADLSYIAFDLPPDSFIINPSHSKLDFLVTFGEQFFNVEANFGHKSTAVLLQVPCLSSTVLPWNLWASSHTRLLSLKSSDTMIFRSLCVLIALFAITPLAAFATPVVYPYPGYYTEAIRCSNVTKPAGWDQPIPDLRNTTDKAAIAFKHWTANAKAWEACQNHRIVPKPWVANTELGGSNSTSRFNDLRCIISMRGCHIPYFGIP